MNPPPNNTPTANNDKQRRRPTTRPASAADAKFDDYKPKFGFFFPGQGAQSVGMAKVRVGAVWVGRMRGAAVEEQQQRSSSGGAAEKEEQQQQQQRERTRSSRGKEHQAAGRMPRQPKPDAQPDH